MKKTSRAFALSAVTGVVGATAFWFAPAASAATAPIVVKDPSQVPAAAVEDVVSTYPTNSPCETTRSWVLTTPGQHHESTTRIETRWSQEIAAVPAEHRYMRTIEGQTHAAVTGYKYQRVVKGQEATKSYKYKKTVTYYTVEHKQVRPKVGGAGWTNAELDWLKTHATTTGSQTDRQAVWTLNDEVVNAANVNPFDYPQQSWENLGSLSVYGFRGDSNGGIQYYITKVEASIEKPTDALFYQTHKGTIYYTGGDPNTSFSPKESDAVWVTTAPSGDWVQYASRTNDDAVEDQTFFYDGTAEGTTDLAGAVAQSSAPGAPWVAFGDEVTIEEAYTDPDVTEYYTGDDSRPGATEDEAVYTAANPGGGWVAFGDEKPGTGTEAYTVYYNPQDPTDLTDTDLGEDNWTDFPVNAGPAGWAFEDEREVSNEDGYDDPAVLTTYVYADGVLCAVTPEKPTTTVTPKKPTTSSGAEELAHTGASTSIAVFGAALLAGGAATSVMARRRKA